MMSCLGIGMMVCIFQSPTIQQPVGGLLAGRKTVAGCRDWAAEQDLLAIPLRAPGDLHKCHLSGYSGSGVFTQDGPGVFGQAGP